MIEANLAAQIGRRVSLPGQGEDEPWPEPDARASDGSSNRRSPMLRRRPSLRMRTKSAYRSPRNGTRSTARGMPPETSRIRPAGFSVSVRAKGALDKSKPEDGVPEPLRVLRLIDD